MPYQTQKAYMSSRTRADAPPPPLQIPATPYFPFLWLSTCDNIASSQETNKKHKSYTGLCRYMLVTPNNVTKIRAPLHPNGCPKDTAPPCTFTFS